jgi:hypothetical protein
MICSTLLATRWTILGLPVKGGRVKKNHILFLMLILLAGSSACIPDPPNPGFRIRTWRIIYSFRFGYVPFEAENIALNGNLLRTFTGETRLPRGNVDAFIGNSGPDARYDVVGGITPGIWRLGENSGDCAGQSLNTLIQPGESLPLNCRDQPFAFAFTLNPSFTATPSAIDVNSAPASITVNGFGISSDGGMPTVEYYDGNGILVAQVTASEVAADGTQLSASGPDLSLMTSGSNYILIVRNPDGTVAGDSLIYVFDSNIAPPDPDPGPGGTCGDTQCPEELLIY